MDNIIGSDSKIGETPRLAGRAGRANKSRSGILLTMLPTGATSLITGVKVDSRMGDTLRLSGKAGRADKPRSGTVSTTFAS